MQTTLEGTGPLSKEQNWTLKNLDRDSISNCLAGEVEPKPYFSLFRRFPQRKQGKLV
ncbi:hypothetical protein ACU8KH_04644 [Lachancea thermotolerans]